MNRRDFIKQSFLCVGALAVAPCVVAKNLTNPAGILISKGKVRYRGIDWRLDCRVDIPAAQMCAETTIKGKRRCIAYLLDAEDAKSGKNVSFCMDIIADRVERQKQRNFYN